MVWTNIRRVLTEAKSSIVRTVNSTVVSAYWEEELRQLINATRSLGVE